MNQQEVLRNLDNEIRRLKDELNQLERAKRVIKKKQTEYNIIW